MIGGDMKMLAILFGLKAANSTFPCPWCKWNKNEIDHYNDQQDIHRTLRDANDHYNEEEFGYKNEPIIKFIDFDCIIIDTLHLHLRLTDQLFGLFFQLIIGSDGNDSIDINKRPSLKAFKLFLTDECKITKPFIEDIDNIEEKIRLRNLNGSERCKIFEKLFEDNGSMIERFPLIEEDDLINHEYVWFNYYEIFKEMKSINQHNINQETIEQLELKVERWLGFYCLINNSENITPYIHAFKTHCTEQLLKYKDINIYCLQGLEKLNDVLTKTFHMATNKHNENKEYLTQIFSHRNRTELNKLGITFDLLDIM